MATAREFLQRPTTFQPERHHVNGWFACQVPDGINCLWDGGITSGVPLRMVPWAGIESPNGNYKHDLLPDSTGLWDEHAEPVALPPTFLKLMPPFICHGVIVYGPTGIEFAAIAAPTVEQFYRDGTLRTARTHLNMVFDNCMKWIRDNELYTVAPRADSNFAQELFAMSAWDGWTDEVYIQRQHVLSDNYEESCFQVQNLIDERETLMFRDPQSVWVPYRVDHCLTFRI